MIQYPFPRSHYEKVQIIQYKGFWYAAASKNSFNGKIVYLNKLINELKEITWIINEPEPNLQFVIQEDQLYLYLLSDEYNVKYSFQNGALSYVSYYGEAHSLYNNIEISDCKTIVKYENRNFYLNQKAYCCCMADDQLTFATVLEKDNNFYLTIFDNDF